MVYFQWWFSRKQTKLVITLFYEISQSSFTSVDWTFIDDSLYQKLLILVITCWRYLKISQVFGWLSWESHSVEGRIPSLPVWRNWMGVSCSAQSPTSLKLNRRYCLRTCMKDGMLKFADILLLLLSYIIVYVVVKKTLLIFVFFSWTTPATTH